MITKKKRKVIVSKKDIIIPKGTIFECIDNTTRNYGLGNYEALIEMSQEINVGSFVICDDFNKDNFELKDI